MSAISSLLGKLEVGVASLFSMTRVNIQAIPEEKENQLTVLFLFSCFCGEKLEFVMLQQLSNVFEHKFIAFDTHLFVLKILLYSSENNMFTSSYWRDLLPDTRNMDLDALSWNFNFAICVIWSPSFL